MNPDPRPRVVVADDHPGILESALATLGPRFEVVAAVGRGDEAVAAAADLDPDFVVLDIAMPGLNGFEAASIIRARGPRPHIAFMSAHLGDDYILEGQARGGAAFVVKARMAFDLIPALEHAGAGHFCLPSARVLPRLRQPRGPSHDLQLYWSDDALLDAVAGYFEAALEAEDSIVAIATAPHLGGLERRLRARRIDPAALSASGRYSALDAHAAVETVVVAGTPDDARFADTLDPVIAMARAAGGRARHVSVFGEMAPQLCARNQDEAAFALEAIADAYAVSRQLSILCAYRTDAWHGSTACAERVCAGHAAIALADAHR